MQNGLAVIIAASGAGRGRFMATLWDGAARCSIRCICAGYLLLPHYYFSSASRLFRILFGDSERRLLWSMRSLKSFFNGAGARRQYLGSSTGGAGLILPVAALWLLLAIRATLGNSPVPSLILQSEKSTPAAANVAAGMGQL